MRKLIFSLQLAFVFISVNAQEMRFTTSDGVDLYVRVEGAGTPCLFIHGGPGSGSYFFEKLMADSLEQHFQMIYLDQRGAGRSMSPKDYNYSMDRMVMDFEELKTFLGIKQWILVGHSFGGILQMGYAKSYPESIIGMVMMNCTLNLTQSYTTSWVPKACEFLNITDVESYFDKSKPLMENWNNLGSQLNEKELMWKMGYSSPVNMAMLLAMWGDNEIPDWNYDCANHAIKIEEYWYDYKKYTGKIEVPVLFYYGTEDWMVGPEHYKGVYFPNVIFWSSDVGHFPFIDKKDDLLKAIRSYQKKYDL